MFAFTSIFVCVVLVLVAAWKRWQATSKHVEIADTSQSAASEKKRTMFSPDANSSLIEPLPSFKWQDVQPAQLRPFKPVYYITMAIQTHTPSELIEMDSQYLDRVTTRRDLINSHPATVHGHLPEGIPALRELYTYLLTAYLPLRYPTMFALSPDRQTFHNLATGRSWPTAFPEDDPDEALRVLGETVEDDLFLLRETEEGQHRAVAFVCCFPTGFDPRGKLGMVLADIHGPVPGYEKIAASMERFFSRLEPGKSVKRCNWSVTPHTKLFAPSVDEKFSVEEELRDDLVDIAKTRFRVEQQSLTRLPVSRGILFSFKTLLYPLAQIKAEGQALELADAIEGLKKGNAPEMWTYKGATTWSDVVLEYLRDPEA